MVLLAGGLLVGFFWIFSERGPSYQGKNFDAWLLQVHEDGLTKEFYAAVDAIGTNALEDLLRYSTAQDSEAKIGTFNFLKEKLGVTMPLGFSEDRRGPALAALMALGPKASPIIPKLVEGFEQEPARMLFPLVFIRTGTEVAFISLCESTNHRIRTAAAEGLARVQNGIGYGDQKKSGTYTTNALFTMYLTLGDSTVDWVAQNLAHSNVWVRRASAEYLGEHPGITSRALPDLKMVLEDDESPLVREAAERAITAIEGPRE